MIDGGSVHGGNVFSLPGRGPSQVEGDIRIQYRYGEDQYDTVTEFGEPVCISTEAP